MTDERLDEIRALAHDLGGRIVSPVMVRELIAEVDQLRAERSAMLHGLDYDDEHGVWYDTTTGRVVCLAEHLVAHFAVPVPT